LPPAARFQWAAIAAANRATPEKNQARREKKPLVRSLAGDTSAGRATLCYGSGRREDPLPATAFRGSGSCAVVFGEFLLSPISVGAAGPKMGELEGLADLP